MFADNEPDNVDMDDDDMLAWSFEDTAMRSTKETTFRARLREHGHEGLLLELDTLGELLEGDGLSVEVLDQDDRPRRCLCMVRRVRVLGARALLELEYVEGSFTRDWRGSLPRESLAHLGLVFRVRYGQDGLLLRFYGEMTPKRSAAFRREVEQCLARGRPEPLPVFIDALALSTSPPAALPDFRAALAALVRGGSVIGVLLGSHTVAMLQLMRMVRESDIGNALVVAEGRAQAHAIWQSIVPAGDHSGSYRIPLLTSQESLRPAFKSNIV